MGWELQQQGGEIAILEEARSHVAERRKLEDGSDGEAFLVDCNAECRPEYANLVAHRAARRAFSDSALEVLPDASLRERHGACLGAEEVLKVRKRLCCSSTRSVALPLVMALETRPKIG